MIRNQGRRVGAAWLAANAWIGGERFVAEDEDDYDAVVWEQQQADPPERVRDEDAVLLSRDLDFEAYEVVPDDRLSFLLERRWGHRGKIDPKRWYPSVDKRTGRRTFRLFVFLFGDQQAASLRSVVGMPGPDGYLAVLSVLSDTDRLLPVEMIWRGKHPGQNELVRRVDRALSFLQSVLVRPKISAPILPPEILDSIEEARREGPRMPRTSRQVLVRQLLELDRTSFLEALDRLYPWILAGDAVWLDKEPAVADRLWNLLRDMEDEGVSISGRLRLAPWKTALGQPRDLRMPVNEVSPKLSIRPSRAVSVARNPTGTYSAFPGKPYRD